MKHTYFSFEHIFHHKVGHFFQHSLPYHVSSTKIHGTKKSAQQDPCEGRQGLKLQSVHTHVGTIIKG